MTVFVIFNYRFAEPQKIEIENMRMAGIAVYQAAVPAEKIAVPKGEVSQVGQKAIGANRVVRHDQRRLNNVNKIQLRIRFYHLPHIHDFEFVIMCHAVPFVIVMEQFFAARLLLPTHGFLCNENPARCKVKHFVIFYRPPKSHFKVDPREIRKFQIVFKDLFKRFIPKQNFRGKAHIR